MIQSLNHIDPRPIIAALHKNHDFRADLVVPFRTAQTTGYIPNEHKALYLDSGLFVEDKRGGITFAHGIDDFDDKTHAMQEVVEDLIEMGLIERSTEPHFQERAVGGADRLTNPEFKINRACYRYFGFPADGVFLNLLVDQGERFLFQKRAARVEYGNQLDFAAGGAVKFPQDVNIALEKQIREETGVTIADVSPLVRSDFRFSTPEKKWVTSLTHHISTARSDGLKLSDFDREEVSGFEAATPEQAVEYCANGRFNAGNMQSFLAAMITQDMLPSFPGHDEVRALIEPHIQDLRIKPSQPKAPQAKAGKPPRP
jgi:8-oxo-dGTP pyrophosphatase MutT (NUDIX family)